MKTKIKNIDLTSSVTEIDRDDLQSINGGGFAYDLGFLLRECIVYIKEGTGTRGTAMALSDFGLNYKPLN